MFVMTMISNTAAANDSVANHTRCRTLPIPESVTSVPGYPAKLVIFQTHASRFWQVRCFFGRTVIKSLRTTSKRDAIQAAKRFYDQRSYEAREPAITQPVASENTPSFTELAPRMLAIEQNRVDRGEITAKCAEITRARLNRWVLPFFSAYEPQQVDATVSQAFLEHLSRAGLVSASIKQYLTVANKLMHCAYKHGSLSKPVTMPAIKTRSQPRGHFTLSEYRQLLRAAKAIINADWHLNKQCHRSTKGGIFTQTHGVPPELVWLIGFMVNSFVRPVDIKLIKHQHVEIVRGPQVYLRLRLPETKRHRSQIVTLPAAVRIYETLRDYQSGLGLAAQDDYVFLPQVRDRQAAIFLLDKFFGRVLDQVNLRLGQFGQRRTLYSLRHSAITFRLLYGRGIDLLTLARNARTSTQMIDRFYASELSAEMNVAMLHSRR